MECKLEDKKFKERMMNDKAVKVNLEAMAWVKRWLRRRRRSMK